MITMPKSQKEEIIERTAAYVKKELLNESSGHDWWHILRVRNNALIIAHKEKGADIFVVELAALLHAMADWKFHGGNEKINSSTARKWLKSQKVDDAAIAKVCTVIDEIPFKGAGVKTTPSTLEGKIVQDADRLDAIGAIGIARAFAYGGKIEREIYNPTKKPKIHTSFKSYKKESFKNTKATSINHFYEKLLLLKGLMNTDAGKELAKGRDKYMKDFLSRFYKEWNGKM
jgi:uncharacterized protein